MRIGRTELNKKVNKVVKAIQKGIKDGKTVEDVLLSKDVETIIGDYCATGDNGYTVYDFNLGMFDGKITKTSLDKDEINNFGYINNSTKDVIFTINECLETGKVEAFASVLTNWQDRYKNWHEEYVVIKRWEII